MACSYSRKGINAKQAEYAVNKYCSYHKIGTGIFMDLSITNSSN